MQQPLLRLINCCYSEEFKKSGKTGLGAMIKTVAGKIKEIFQAGMEKLREKFGKKVEARAVWGWDSWKAGWEKTKQALSDTFKPHIDTLTQVSNNSLLQAVLK